MNKKKHWSKHPKQSKRNKKQQKCIKIIPERNKGNKFSMSLTSSVSRSLENKKNIYIKYK